MTAFEIESAIKQCLNTVAIGTGVDVPYCTALRDAVRASVPGSTLDVFHRHTELVVDVRLGERRVTLTTPLI